MGLRMKNFNIMEGPLKNPIFKRGGFPKNQCIRGNCLKRGAWTLSRFNGEGGGLAKRGGGVFEGV